MLLRVCYGQHVIEMQMTTTSDGQKEKKKKKFCSRRILARDGVVWSRSHESRNHRARNDKSLTGGRLAYATRSLAGSYSCRYVGSSRWRHDVSHAKYFANNGIIILGQYRSIIVAMTNRAKILGEISALLIIRRYFNVVLYRNL